MLALEVIKSRYLHKIFKATPLSSLLILPDSPRFTIAEVNTAYLKITGTKEEDLVGKSIFEVFPATLKDYTPDIIFDLRHSLLTAISTGATNTMTTFKHRISINEDNEFVIRYWDFENIPIAGDNGNIELIIHSLIDVTEKKLHQQKQQELKEDALASPVLDVKNSANNKGFNNAAWEKEKEKRAAQLLLADKELSYQKEEKRKRAAELTIANKELVFQTQEKGKRAAELVIANKELVFQTSEKKKRAAELFIADEELAYQKNEKFKRAAELTKAYKELAFEIEEKGNRAAELIIANVELVYQNEEKEG